MDQADGRTASATARETPHSHSVQFYETEAVLADAVADHIEAGLRSGAVGLIVARRPRCDVILQRLRVRGLAEYIDADRLAFVDACDALASFMAGDRPDRQLMLEAIREMVAHRRAAASAADAPLCVYGEMVDILCEQGLVEAAMEVEETWNVHLADDTANLLCGYAMSNFDRASSGAAFDRVCDLHQHVRPPESAHTAATTDASGTDLARLAQRARALETEIERRKQLESELRNAQWARRVADAAERKAREEADRASRAKNELLAALSHELRNPLNTIVGYQNLLQQEVAGPLNADQHRFLDRLGYGARQLMMLVDQILNLSRIESGREEVLAQEFDLLAIVRESVEIIRPHAARAELEIATELPGQPISCRTDPAKVRQILLNLLSNAVKFTTEGSVTVRVTVEEDLVRCEVRDTGIGIAAADIATIFDQFVQVDHALRGEHSGSGLGLTVSRRLARLLGGDIDVASDPGVGSVFTVRLPIEAPAVETTP